MLLQLDEAGEVGNQNNANLVDEVMLDDAHVNAAPQQSKPDSLVAQLEG